MNVLKKKIKIKITAINNTPQRQQKVKKKTSKN